MVNAVLMPEKSLVNAGIEALFTPIINIPKPMAVGLAVIYRPPYGNINSFLEQFRKRTLSLRKEKSYVPGDFNINLHKPSHHGFHLHFLNYGYAPH